MTNEQSILLGICPDCGSPTKVRTPAEIQEAKADIGMGPDDDFFAGCDAREAKYLPASSVGSGGAMERL